MIRRHNSFLVPAPARLVAATYLAALLTLLANDFLLKRVYGGALTGKLSDFAGLFAFALFAGAMAPRHARAICWAVAVVFTVWKSPLSQPAIDLWNAASALQIDRVVDYSDLAALAVLPFAAGAAAAARRAAEARGVTLWIAAVSFFAFTATSVERYSADMPADPGVRSIADSRSAAQVRDRLEACGFRTHVYALTLENGRETFLSVGLSTDARPERDVSLRGKIHKAEGGVTIEFDTIEIFRQQTPVDVAPYAEEAVRRIRKCLAPA